jgi:hypothetical protein
MMLDVQSWLVRGLIHRIISTVCLVLAAWLHQVAAALDPELFSAKA